MLLKTWLLLLLLLQAISSFVFYLTTYFKKTKPKQPQETWSHDTQQPTSLSTDRVLTNPVYQIHHIIMPERIFSETSKKVPGSGGW